MSQELNNTFIENPQEFLKHHLIVKNRLETEQPFINPFTEVLINFEYISEERPTPLIAKRLSKYFKRLKDLSTVEIQFHNYIQNVSRGNFLPTPQNTGIRIYYVPYSRSSGYYRNLEQYADFVFTHTLSGCDIYISNPNANPFRMLHMGGNASDQTIQRKVTECYGDAPYRKICEPQYANFKGNEAENINLIGIRNSQNNWDFYAQGYDTSNAISPKYKARNNADGMTHLSFFTSRKITNWIESNAVG